MHIQIFKGTTYFILNIKSVLILQLECLFTSWSQEVFVSCVSKENIFSVSSTFRSLSTEVK